MNTTPIRFGLIVTGKGERENLHQPFKKSLEALGFCVVEVVCKCEQLRPRKTDREFFIVGTGFNMTDRREEFALRARAYLMPDPTNRYLLVIDDLEGHDPLPTFRLYRAALDAVLAKPGLSTRASVHFLVNMLEAYFFAHADALNQAAGFQVIAVDHSTDVEAIPHPKNRLKQLWSAFGEVEPAGHVLKQLDLAHVLSRPDQCCWLRSLVAWCMDRLKEHGAFYGAVDPARFRLNDGCKTPLTYNQGAAASS